MNEVEEKEPGHSAAAERKPYERPAVSWEETLDVRRTLAVACGKIAGRGGFCNAAPTS